MYKHILPRGQPGPRDGKERTESGAGTETVTGSGTGTFTVMGDETGMGTGTGVEVNEGAQDGDGAGTGTGAENEHRMRTGTEARTVAEMGTMIAGTRIGEDGRGAKKRKKPQTSCRRHVGNGGDLGEKRETCRKKRVGPVAAKPDNLERDKEAGGVAQGTQGSSKNCTSRESVSPLPSLIRGFRDKYDSSPLRRINASGIE